MQLSRHRSEIQNRICQLQQKLNNRNIDSIRPYLKQIEIEKTNNKTKLIQTARPKLIQFPKPTQTLRYESRHCERMTSAKENMLQYQPEKFNNRPLEDNQQLIHIMKEILEGQKNIQKQLLMLKNDYLKESKKKQENNHLQAFQNRASFGKYSLIQLQNKSNNHSQIVKQDKSNRQIKQNIQNKQIQQNKQPKKLQSFLLQHQQQKEKQLALQITNKNTKRNKQESRIRAVSHKMHNPKRYNPKKIEQMLNGAEKDKKQRYVITEEIKSRIWKQVEHQICTNKHLQQAFHKNSKHEQDHLINVFELQKKLKEDLLGKVLQQCTINKYK